MEIRSVERPEKIPSSQTQVGLQNRLSAAGAHPISHLSLALARLVSLSGVCLYLWCLLRSSWTSCLERCLAVRTAL